MKTSSNQYKKEIEALQLRLSQAEDALDAIRNGEVDAIVINGEGGEKVFSLSSAETPYRIIIEKMNEGAVIITSAGLITYCNHRFAEMVAVPMEKLTGSSFLQFMHEKELADYTTLLKTGLKDGLTKEISYHTKNKQEIYFRLSFSSLPMEMLGEICILVMDITELKEKEKSITDLNNNLEEKIKERTAQYEAVNNELEAFSYSVSHDLRAPLRAVNSYAQIMIEDHGNDLDEDGRNIMESIRYNGAKMGKLIDELLSFSRLGRKEPERVSVNMEQLIKQVITDLKQHYTIRAQIKLSPLPIVQADNLMMYQVLYNLLSNAIKYSSKKQHPVIEVYTQQINKKTVFVIKDNGAGFDMRYADKLFGVFQRMHSEKEFEGNGVGLAIVKRIITKFGGEVWGEAKINEGASFYFTIN